MAKRKKKSQKKTSEAKKDSSNIQRTETQDQEQRSGALARREPDQITSRTGDPFMLMRMLSDDLDRVAASFGFGRFPRPGDLMQQGGIRTWSPQIEVSEDNGRLMVRADLPGLKKDDVTVEITDGMMVISGERKQEQEEKRKGYYRTERSYGSFSRAIPLPGGAKMDDVKASFNDGVLEITVPTSQEQQKQSKQVQIQ
jgi:HSP20 family protein